MSKTTQNIPLLQHLFGKSSLADISCEELLEIVKEYPYFAQARWLLAEKKWPQDRAAIQIAGVYTYHPLRLQQHFSGKQPDPVKKPSPEIKESNATTEEVQNNPAPPEQSDAPGSLIGKAIPENQPAAPLIQPLFAQDYFAYTGTKLPDNIENDKRPTMEQLYSFTDWLRTMKRPKGTPDPDIQENEGAGIQKNAAESVQPGEEVLTEAMAEVRAGKGQIDKAIAIYEKLSLSNPEKSAYFAQKTEALKNL